MQIVSQLALKALECKIPAIIVRLEAVKGSAPRASGTVMLVTADHVSGTLGGGHLEWDSIAKARALLTGPPVSGFTAWPVRSHVALGPALGQCCGGALDVVFEPLTHASWIELSKVDRPLFRLHLFGAGHVGRALVTVLSTIRCDVRWLDEREDEFPTDLPPRVSKLAVDSPQAEVREAQPGDFYLVLTHRHDLDELIVREIVKRRDAGFVGLIGSKTKRARFSSRLQQVGLSMDTVTCPVGIAVGDEASRKEPGQIALAMAHVLLSEAYSREQTSSQKYADALHQPVEPNQR